jgi:Fic family protein
MTKIDNKYPWINFKINLNRLSFRTWIQIGECLSKIEHISKVPLKPGITKEMHTVYLVKGVQATTAIEGNSLTEEEVRMRLERKLELPPSKEYLGKEVDNIIALCNELRKEKIPGEKKHKIKLSDICEYNKKILQDIPSPQHITPGKIRIYNVVVGGYHAPDHKDVPYLINKYCEWLNSGDFIIDEEQPILNSIIKAVLAHLYFALIHPFGDGNGRTARILEFYILLSSGIPTPTAHLLSNHYNATRKEYYRNLDETRKRNDANNFITYAIQGFLDGLREQLTYIFSLIIDVSWESFVYEVFDSYKHHAITTKRRRNLLLELSKKAKPVPKDDLITISKSMVDAYRNKTFKTITRDINELKNMDLVEEDEKGCRAKKEKIFAFIPVGIK